MAASFVNSDGQLYLRLTKNTTTVNFAAVSEADNLYDFKIYGSNSGTITLSKIYADIGSGTIYYTSNANPFPPTGSIDNSRFPGCFSAPGYTSAINYTFSGSGTRDYAVSGTNQLGEPYLPDTTNLMCLGGSSLDWGSNLCAYPGSGYITDPRAVGVKRSGVWRNSYNIFIKDNDEWQECINAWIKQDGNWKKFYQNFGNSSWINMLEGTDDAIDFAIKVIAIN